MPQPDFVANIVTQWFNSLPVLGVWAVGLSIAVRRRREHPQASKLAMISCVLSLLTLMLIPPAQNIGSKINLAFVPLLLNLIWSGLTALSIGLLLKATFLDRGESSANASKPDELAPAFPSRPLEKALRILAGIARWSWRLCSIALALFVGVFLLASLSQGMHISTDPADLLCILVCLVLFGAMLLAWWREALGGLIILLTGLVVGVVMAVMNWHTTQNVGNAFGDFKDGLGPAILPILMLFSWSLRTLADRSAVPRKRRLALVVTPVLALLVACCVWGMFPIHFNP
jgi:hypothetical protein